MKMSVLFQMTCRFNLTSQIVSGKEKNNAFVFIVFSITFTSLFFLKSVLLKYTHLNTRFGSPAKNDTCTETTQSGLSGHSSPHPILGNH